LAKRFSLDLVGRTWDCRNHDIGDGQAFFKGELGWVCDVVPVEPVSSGSTRAGSFGVFLYGVDIYREYSSTVVCQQGSEGSADDLRPIDYCDDPSVGSISVRQDPVIDPGVFEAFNDRERRTWKDRFDRPRWGLIVDGGRDLLC